MKPRSLAQSRQRNICHVSKQIWSYVRPPAASRWISCTSASSPLPPSGELMSTKHVHWCPLCSSLKSSHGTGFNINWAKGTVQLAQCMGYLGLILNFIWFHNQVVWQYKRLTSLTQCLPLIIASVISLVHLGLLMMRNFQHWVAVLHLCPHCHLSQRMNIK